MTAIQGEPAFAGVVCIKRLAIHIVIKTRDFFKGTNHEDDWLFYHLALSLMTTKGCSVLDNIVLACTSESLVRIQLFIA